MEFSPDPLQTLLLWRLLADDGGAFQQGLKPDLPKPRRDPLVKAGLLEVVKRRKADGGRPVNYLQLTDAGWEWAAAHLDAEVSPRSTAAGPILRSLLTKLKTHLSHQNLSLADFVRPPGEEKGAGRESRIEDVATGAVSATDRVRRVCERLAQSHRGVRIYLADVRRELGDLSCDAVDSALRELERDRTLVLYPLDNPQEIRPQDADAALNNSAGRPRHIAYLP
ncbi:hypothetical protein GC176_01545 [bacterium]|nr:hypothetical protein [bacterium]